MLERSIHCFLAQTYLNKELIILYEKDDDATDSYIRSMAPSFEIKTVAVSPEIGSKLGELRNIAIQEASGTYVCQWDDDDWFHARRLEYQYKITVSSQKAGCIMKQWIVFDATVNKAYASHYRHWEGSIFCKRSILLQAKYENKSEGEDTQTINQLVAEDLLYPITNAPHLYIYVYHGYNTWNYHHWKQIFEAGTILPDPISSVIAKIVTHTYDVTEGSALLNQIAGEYKMKIA